MFKNLKINNFKGIKELEIKKFNKLNLIIGKNNVGKSSLIEALFFLINPGNPSLPIKTLQFRASLINSNTLRHLFNGGNVEFPIKLTCDVENPNQNRILEIEAHRKVPSVLHLEESDESIANGTDSYAGDTDVIKNNSIDGLSFEISINEKGNKERHHESEIFLTENPQEPLKINKPKDYEEYLNGRFVNPITELFYSDVVTKFDEIQKSKKKTNIMKAIRILEPKLLDLSISGDRRIDCDVGFDRLIPLSLLGSGTKHLMHLIFSLESTKNGILLIDEIENGFHYSVLKDVWKVVYETAIRLNIQVFATTHSHECIKAFASLDSSFDDAENNLKLYRLEKDKEKHFPIPYNLETLKSSLEAGWEVR